MQHRYLHASLIGVSLALGGLSSASMAQSAVIRSFSLPAMPLGDALRAVARATGQNLIVDDTLLAGRVAPPLVGTYGAQQAVSVLLSGTSLRQRTIDGTILVVGPSRSDQGAAVKAPATAASDNDVIIVTGTNVRGAQPTSPVITITRREIDQAAPSSVEELMRKLPQNVSSGVGQENFAVTGAGADITDHGAGINLRGLGQRATLTLVNGRRLAPSGSGSFVDVSLIPISAVERIEIVTDGASAIYGSDAVGGVVNLILRKDFTGLETLTQAGTSTRGGGDALLLGATGGAQWTGGHALLSYEYRREDEITAGDRAFTINLPNAWALVPRERRHSVYANVSQSLGSRLSFEASALYSNRNTRRSFFVAGPIVPVNAVANARTFGATAALTWQPFADWRTEASAAYSESRTRERQDQPAGQGLFNRFDTTNRIADFNLKANGTLFNLPGGGIKAAFGGEYRHEYYADVFETLINPANPEFARRNVVSAFGELSVPLVGATNKRPGLNRLILTAAGRVDHYQGLGTSFDPKVGLLYSPSPGLDLRTSYSTSFRAPLLSEVLGYYNAYLYPAALLYIDKTQAIPGVAAALVGANPKVRPETSKSWTAGIDWAPPTLVGLRLTSTYYAIRFSNRIAQPTQQIVIIGNPALAPAVTLNPSLGVTEGLLAGAGQVLDFSGPGFTNGGATAADIAAIVDVRISNTAESRTSGLDLGASYDFAVAEHHLRADVNVNKVFKFDDRLTSASPLIRTLDTPYHPVDLRARGSLGWSWRRWNANVALNYTAGYHDNRAGRDTPVRSFATLDVGLGTEVGGARGKPGSGLRLSFNVQNLLDTDPPKLAPEPGFTRGIGYDPVNASGRGRVVSLQLRKGW
ncbi:MAG: TonB-dependent receptor [Pseudomonadota bacterium]|nr:TonB-dependent receptor [Pseudomonadota bacterium]